MTTEQKQLAYNTEIRDAMNRAGRAVAGAAGGLAIPLTIAAAPLAGTLSLVGGAIGSKIGGNTAENLLKGDTAGYTTADQYYGQIGTAMPADQYYRPVGEIVGGTIGGIAGGALGTHISPGMPRIRYSWNYSSYPNSPMFAFKKGGILCRNI